MDEKAWEARMKSFLQKTGEDFKRFGTDIKVEAQKLLEDVKDQEGKERIKQGLKSASYWARKTAEEVADVVVEGTRKAEEAFVKASDRARDFATKPATGAAATVDDEASPAPTPPSPPPVHEAAAAPPKKSVGRAAKPKKAAAKRPSRAKKTIGKKKGEGPAGDAS